MKDVPPPLLNVVKGRDCQSLEARRSLQGRGQARRQRDRGDLGRWRSLAL